LLLTANSGIATRVALNDTSTVIITRLIIELQASVMCCGHTEGLWISWPIGLVVSFFLFFFIIVGRDLASAIFVCAIGVSLANAKLNIFVH